MKRQILLVNYTQAAIPDLDKSRYTANIDYQSIRTAGELDFPPFKKSPDVVVIFLQMEKQDCLNRIAELTKLYPDKEIIAAVPLEMLETGIRTLQHGAGDFFTLPAAAHTLDFYINRALERNYLHKHLCFNESCYKSRYAVSEKRYKQLFNEVPCFIYVVDRDYQITDCNRKFEEYFGSHIGEYCFGILKNRDEPCTKCKVAQTFKDGKNHASEMQIISSDGVRHVVLCWIAPIRDADDQITHGLVMLTDITEARNLEDHLTSLGFMIGSISHGIKGLLTSLDGGIYMMEKGFETGNADRIREGFEQSRQMTARIKNLVMDILYYTKTRKMEWTRYSLRRFTLDILGMIGPVAEKHGVDLEDRLDVLTEDDGFEVDEKSLQTALVNILENSIEACVDGSDRANPQILFHARMDAEKVLFTIQDNGQGMDRETLKNLFTIFFSSKGNRGTGLGLYIANKVVKQHRGEIKVKSDPGRGTKFLVKIPRIVPETARNPRGVGYRS